MAAVNETEGLDFVDQSGQIGDDAASFFAEKFGVTENKAREILENTEAVAAERKTILVGLMKAAGIDSAEAIVDGLGTATGGIARTLDLYNEAIARGISPILVAMGRPRVTWRRGSTGWTRGGPGGVLEGFAEGGLHEQHVAQISAAGGPIRVWGEPETAGEAFIPLPGTRQLQEAA